MKYMYPTFLENDVLARNGLDTFGAGVGYAVEFAPCLNFVTTINSTNDPNADDTTRYSLLSPLSSPLSPLPSLLIIFLKNADRVERSGPSQ